jgi:hypothetical protein
MQNNRLLAALRRKDRDHVIAACGEVELTIGDVLWEPNKRIRHVYFPLDSFISQLVPVEARENLELSMVGNEGMLGTSLVLGVNSSMLQARVQGSGTALRLDVASFRRELEHIPALRKQLNRYIYVLQNQLATTAACINFHSLDLHPQVPRPNARCSSRGHNQCRGSAAEAKITELQSRAHHDFEPCRAGEGVLWVLPGVEGYV